MSGPRTILLLLSALLAPVRSQPAPAGLRLTQRIPLQFEYADATAFDAGPSGGQCLILADTRGRIYRLDFLPGGTELAPAPRQILALPHPGFSLLGRAAFESAGAARSLVVASPSGLHAYPIEQEGDAPPSPVELTGLERRFAPRFTYRLGAPRFAEICHDINGNGRSEILLPVQDRCEIWMASSAQGEPLRLNRAASLDLRIQRSEQTGGTRLSDDLESLVVIPRLMTRDVNGDGRLDILMQDGRNRAWHIQKPDGSIPMEPDVRLDLRIFEDTTPSGRVMPGTVLAGSNRQTLLSRDLDGNGFTDHVIAHGRKIWILPGTANGPQFTSPSQILKSSDDITTLLLADLDQDGRADLITLKLLIPSVGSLLASALGSLTVEVSAVAYAGREGARFDNEPKWRNTLRIELPSITRLLKNPQAILQRFQDAGRTATERLLADFDGDGAGDLVSIDPGEEWIEFWSRVREGGRESSGDLLLLEVLFSKDDSKWDLDRLVSLVERLADEDMRRFTGGRPPDKRLQIEDAANRIVSGFFALKSAGDRGASLLIVRRDASGAAEILHYRGGETP